MLRSWSPQFTASVSETNVTHFHLTSELTFRLVILFLLCLQRTQNGFLNLINKMIMHQNRFVRVGRVRSWWMDFQESLGLRPERVYRINNLLIKKKMCLRFGCRWQLIFTLNNWFISVKSLGKHIWIEWTNEDWNPPEWYPELIYAVNWFVRNFKYEQAKCVTQSVTNKEKKYESKECAMVASVQYDKHVINMERNIIWIAEKQV